MTRAKVKPDGRRNYLAPNQVFKADNDAVNTLLAAFGYPKLVAPVTQPTRVYTQQDEEETIDT